MLASRLKEWARKGGARPPSRCRQTKVGTWLEPLLPSNSRSQNLIHPFSFSTIGISTIEVHQARVYFLTRSCSNIFESGEHLVTDSLKMSAEFYLENLHVYGRHSNSGRLVMRRKGPPVGVGTSTPQRHGRSTNMAKWIASPPLLLRQTYRGHVGRHGSRVSGISCQTPW